MIIAIILSNRTRILSGKSIFGHPNKSSNKYLKAVLITSIIFDYVLFTCFLIYDRYSVVRVLRFKILSETKWQ